MISLFRKKAIDDVVLNVDDIKSLVKSMIGAEANAAAISRSLKIIEKVLDGKSSTSISNASIDGINAATRFVDEVFKLSCTINSCPELYQLTNKDIEKLNKNIGNLIKEFNECISDKCKMLVQYTDKVKQTNNKK